MTGSEEKNIYEVEVKAIDGRVLKLGEYQGKVLLIVNVASQCGFTSQYKGLEELYEKYSKRGLEVLGFPCNQFGAQEPGDEKEIQNFCNLNYHVTFPMFAKIEVNGPRTHPLYDLLKRAGKGIFGSEAIKWNFTKFLVDSHGHVVTRYAPATKPEELQNDLEKLLKQS